MCLHLRLHIGLRSVEQLGRYLHDLVDVAVGARLVDRESALVIAVAGLLGVDGMLRIRSRMEHRSSMTADLDTTSSLSVDVPHVVVLVFAGVGHVMVPCAALMTCCMWRRHVMMSHVVGHAVGHAVGHVVGRAVGHALLPSTDLEMNHHARLISGNRR